MHTYQVGVQIVATEAAVALMAKFLETSGNNLEWRSEGRSWFVWRKDAHPSLGVALNTARPMVDFFTNYFGVGPDIWVNFDRQNYRLYDFVIEDRPTI